MRERSGAKSRKILQQSPLFSHMDEFCRLQHIAPATLHGFGAGSRFVAQAIQGQHDGFRRRNRKSSQVYRPANYRERIAVQRQTTRDESH